MREDGVKRMGRRDCIACLLKGLLVAPTVLLMACDSNDGSRPTTIHWDRDTCDYCRMVISDRTFSAQLFSHARHAHSKFDDVGCLVNWLAENEDAAGRATNRLWVADQGEPDQVMWLNARLAAYMSGRRTPMDYGYGAVPGPVPGAEDFEQAQKNMLERNRRRSGS